MKNGQKITTGVPIGAHHSVKELSVLLFNLVLLTIFAVIVLPLHNDRLFGELDGGYLRDFFQFQSNWTTQFHLGMNIFQGMGDISFPVHSQLDPVLALASIFYDSPYMPVFVYTAFSVQYFLSSYLLCQVFKFNKEISLLASWIITLLVMPLLPDFHSMPIFYLITMLTPELVNYLFFTTLLIFCFQRLGTGGWKHSVFLGVSTSLVALYLIYITSVSMILFIPFLFWFSLWLLFCSKTRQEIIIKCASITFVLLILLSLNYFNYLYGLFSFTTANLFSHTLMRPLSQWANIALVFLYPGEKIFAASSWIGGLGLLGILVAFFQSSGIGRRYAFLVLSYICSIIGFGLLATLTASYGMDWYHGPDTLYFEFIIWPLYAGYSVVFILYLYQVIKACWMKCFKPLTVIKKQTGSYSLTKMIVLPVLLFFIFLNIHFNDPPYDGLIYPPKQTAMIDYLQHNVALNHPGVPFKGYVATFVTPSGAEQGTDWLKQVTFDLGTLVPTIGNDYRTVGLWHYQIPTLFEYSPLLSPALYFLVTNLMASSTDQQMRNVMVMTKPNFNLLAALGIKYIISNESYEWQGVKFIQSEPVNDANGMLYLYEIQNSNIATYSPNIFHRLMTVSSFLELAKQSRIDFSKEVYVDRLPHVSHVVKPTRSSLKAVKDGVEFYASSTGTSTVLLPILYSHCLQLEFLDKKPKIFQMLRANIAETMFIFSKHIRVKVSYRSGLLKHANCRIQDTADLKNILSFNKA